MALMRISEHHYPRILKTHPNCTMSGLELIQSNSQRLPNSLCLSLHLCLCLSLLCSSFYSPSLCLPHFPPLAFCLSLSPSLCLSLYLSSLSLALSLHLPPSLHMDCGHMLPPLGLPSSVSSPKMLRRMWAPGTWSKSTSKPPGGPQRPAADVPRSRAPQPAGGGPCTAASPPRQSQNHRAH